MKATASSGSKAHMGREKEKEEKKKATLRHISAFNRERVGKDTKRERETEGGRAKNSRNAVNVNPPPLLLLPLALPPLPPSS